MVIVLAHGGSYESASRYTNGRLVTDQKSIDSPYPIYIHAAEEISPRTEGYI